MINIVFFKKIFSVSLVCGLCCVNIANAQTPAVRITATPVIDNKITVKCVLESYGDFYTYYSDDVYKPVGLIAKVRHEGCGKSECEQTVSIKKQINKGEEYVFPSIIVNQSGSYEISVGVITPGNSAGEHKNQVFWVSEKKKVEVQVRDITPPTPPETPPSTPPNTKPAHQRREVNPVLQQETKEQTSDGEAPVVAEKSKLLSFATSVTGGISNDAIGHYAAALGAEGYLKLNYCSWFGQDVKVGLYLNSGHGAKNDADHYPVNGQLQIQYGIACFTIHLGRSKWALRSNIHAGGGYSFDSRKIGFANDVDFGLRCDRVFLGAYRNQQQKVYDNGLSCIVYGLRLGINY
jgi:hypothetical protein